MPRSSIKTGLRAAEAGFSTDLKVVGEVGRYATFVGLCTCGSPRCLLCGPKIARERAAALRALIGAARVAGGEVYLCTCTLPHDQGDQLQPMRDTIGSAWRSVQQGRRWVALRESLGIVGLIRGDDEPTWGQRGWHPHFHSLVITERPLREEQLLALKDHVYDRWRATVVQRGYREPTWQNGVHIAVSHEEAYVVKLGLADELASGLYKTPREGRLSPIQLLVEYEETKSRKYLELYREYRTAYHGRRKLTYTRGLRERYLTTPERSDEEIAQLEEQGQDLSQQFEHIFDPFETTLWNRALAASPDRQAELLACARRAGVAGVQLYLDLISATMLLADRLALSPYASLEKLRLWVHDPPRSTHAA